MPMAYTFWHSPAVVSEGAQDYEPKLLAFHRALAELAPEGLLSTRVLRFEHVAWLPSAAPVYEDTYFLSGFEVLGTLETAAVSPPLQEAHNAISRLAGSATAGLYKLHSGQWQLKPPLFAQWFSKPVGESYDALYQRFGGISAGDFELWGRQLVLGPTKEFCLRTHRLFEFTDLQPEQAYVATSHWAFSVGAG
jgi:hypothetical protein